jgi:uncharacterized protein (DUF736 family)
MSSSAPRGRSAARKAGITLSVKLDDPALTQAVNCALVEASDREGFILVWSRDSRKAKAE